MVLLPPLYLFLDLPLMILPHEVAAQEKHTEDLARILNGGGFLLL
jgi:hypothetical protein